jgi:hypothetical protein
MTLQEILKAKGLTDEQIKEVISEMKTNKIFTASEENLDVRYGKLKTDHDVLVTKDTESQKLIAELQKATKGQEAVQGKIAEYEATIAKQNEELAKTKVESAVKIALLGAGAKATDIDYLIFKLSSDAEWKAELDDNGNVKGIDDKIKGMKTQFPSQFEASSQKKIEEHKLPDDNNEVKLTKEEFNKMGYQGRLKLKQENPDVYAQMTGKSNE